MASVTRLPYFVANVKDEPKALLKVMLNLKDLDVGLSGLWGFASKEGKGELFVVARESEALKTAWKESGLFAKEGTGFFISGPDRTGALIETLENLVRWGINIRAIDAIAVGSVFGSFLWVDDEDVERAAIALGLP
ncbi:MAG: hypothetical protein V3W18_13210 [candidate division Zixibacteria bacterium]